VDGQGAQGAAPKHQPSWAGIGGANACYGSRERDTGRDGLRSPDSFDVVARCRYALGLGYIKASVKKVFGKGGGGCF